MYSNHLTNTFPHIRIVPQLVQILSILLSLTRNFAHPEAVMKNLIKKKKTGNLVA